MCKAGWRNMLCNMLCNMLAAARGYFGCLCRFPEVRKMVSHVSCTYLEVPWYLIYVTVWCHTSLDLPSRKCRIPH